MRSWCSSSPRRGPVEANKNLLTCDQLRRSAAPLRRFAATCGWHKPVARNGAGREGGEDRGGEEENNRAANTIFHWPSKTSYAYPVIEEGG